MFVAFAVASCTVKLPESAQELDKTPSIDPDYTNIVIPCNIAPMNFTILGDADAYILRVEGSKGGSIEVKGPRIQYGLKEWKSLLDANKGGELKYTIYAREDGQWGKMKSFSNFVAEDPIDEFLTYRLLAPSYEFYTAFSIRERNLSTGKDREVYNNRLHYNPREQQCMNCHQFQNYRTENWQMHVRQVLGGTLIVTGNQSRKVNLKTDFTPSAGVYPAWHPSERLIAYSVNKTRQFFHEKNIHKLEVQDPFSELILYDIDRNEVSYASKDSLAFETFPAWAPDGKTLYYSCSQQPEFARMSSDSIAICFEKLHYDIVKRSFDVNTKTFGEAETVFDALSHEQSALLPRISPDGRFMLFSLGEYGTFHIWHRDSDLWAMNLETGESYALEAANSSDADSYHNWSSNGRWIVFTSRRDDGLFTRTYFAYFDKDGVAHKAFVMPDSKPGQRKDEVYSYNVPEFSIEPIRQSVREISSMIQQDAIPATFAE